MRVAMLSKALVVGSYQRKCELIAAHPDIALTVLAPTHWGSQRLERSYTQGYALRALPIRRSGSFHLHDYPTLAWELDAARPDIVHVDEEPYNLAAFSALRKSRSRGARTLFFTWQNILRTYPPPFSLFERYAYRNVDAVIAGSEEAARVLRKKGCTRAVHVIPQFGVDEAAFAPRVAAPVDAFTVGYAGRLVREKGIDLLLAAMAPLAPARLIITGAGDQEDSLRALAASLGMQERVVFTRRASTDMPAFYAGLDALVLPSRTRPNWKEQFGRVLIEAMASGVPVIGSDSGAIPDVIGDAGLIFREGDAAMLTARLQNVMAQPELARELARRGRQRVLERYTMKAVADATCAVYRALSEA